MLKLRVLLSVLAVAFGVPESHQTLVRLLSPSLTSALNCEQLLGSNIVVSLENFPALVLSLLLYM
ncbi:hypothetical protein KC19_VG033600 [Ceratodon purpureus]|uniref:Uncharacterized protein n=1 Tax=Ceratodon purpureus TaxID=3225 RepID=A0A8T0HLI4_CERPU|nr:hypothetical protein KC19_VG033600 [Ceratodon purpureus]